MPKSRATLVQSQYFVSILKRNAPRKIIIARVMCTPSTSDTTYSLCNILAEFNWIYDFRVTRFFIEKIWNNFASEWNSFMLSLTVEGLNSLPFANEFKPEVPDSLRRLILLANELCSLREPISNKLQPFCLRLDGNTRRGMKSKKEHEVVVMASTVRELCESCHLRHVVDVGSGLGYLGRVLYSELGYHVLGLEAAQDRSDRAMQQCSQLQARKKQEAAAGSFTAIPLTLATDDVDRIREIICGWVDQCNDGNSNVEKVAQNSSWANSCAIVSDSQLSNFSAAENSCTDASSTCTRATADLNSSLAECDEVHVSNSSTDHGLPFTHSSLDDELSATSGYDKSCCTTAKSMTDQTSCTCDAKNASYCVDAEAERTHLISQVSDEDVSFAGGATCTAFSKERQRRVCMVGLHCCGDLVPIMLRHLCALQEISVLLCLGCCYHKMSLTEEGRFTQFPMSRKVSDAIHSAQLKYPQWTGLSPFGMRLAAQETRLRWADQSAEDHEQHVRNVAYRAVVESYWEGTEGSASRIRLRRPVSQRNNCTDFGTYLDSISFDGDKNEVWRIYHELQPYFKYIEPVTCLQVIMQPLVEGLILLDRKLFLEEAGFRCELRQLFDDVISPRSVALIAYKD